MGNECHLWSWGFRGFSLVMYYYDTTYMAGAERNDTTIFIFSLMFQCLATLWCLIDFADKNQWCEGKPNCPVR